MFSVYRTISLRYLSRRWFRALLIVASIMLGVATLVATQALSDTMTKAALASSNPIAGTIDLIVTNGELPIDRALKKDIEKVTGVKEVHLKVFDQAKLIIGDEKKPVMVMGIDLTSNDKRADITSQFKLDPDLAEVEKRYIAASLFLEIPVIVGKELDKLLEKEPNHIVLALKTFTIEKSLKRHSLVRVASVEPRDVGGDMAALGGHVIILDLDNAAKVLGIPADKARRIDVALYPGVDPKKARAEMELILDGRAEVRTIEEQNQALQSAMVGMKTGFSMCGIAALVVGMFLVYNSLAVGVAERRHEIGLLLALGATRDQVWRLFAGEAIVLGTVGSALGIPVGIAMAYLGLQPMQAAISDIFSTLNLRQVELSKELAFVAFAVGILSALIASVIPAVRAAYDKPAEAVRRIPKEPSTSHIVVHIFATCVLVLTGMGMMLVRNANTEIQAAFAGLLLGPVLAACLLGVVCASRRTDITWTSLCVAGAIGAALGVAAGALSGQLGVMQSYLTLQQDGRLIPRRWGTYGGLGLVMIGALLAAPLFAHLAARGLVPIARRFFPIEWRLAADNLVRSPGRTGLVIGALAAGVCLVVETAGIIRSNQLAIRDWVNTSIAADIVVTSGSPVGSGGQTSAMGENVGEELARLPSVEAVIPIRQCTEILFRSVRVSILAFDAGAALAIEEKRLKRPKDLELFAHVSRERNAIIISENFAALHHVHPGDFITLKSPRGAVRLHVIGTVVDYSWNLGTIMMNRSDYVEHWQDKTISIFDVYLKPGYDAKRVKGEMSANLSAQYDLHPLTRDELKRHIDEMIQRLYGVAYGQQVVVMLVAALGVVMALLVSVLQRRREMGLLRAIGASQAQVVYLVLSEAFLMGIFGTIIGVLLAIPLQWYALQVVFLEESGYYFPVYIPWIEGPVIALLAMVIATLAGVGPALYAVRQRIPEAIAYE